MKKSVYRLGDGTMICAECMKKQEMNEPESGWTVDFCQFCDEPENQDRQADDCLDEIINLACKKYSDKTGKSRDEIAAQVEAYFDADTLSEMADQEIKNHLARLFESTEDDYNDLVKYIQ